MSTPAPKKHMNGDALRASELDIASLLIHADTLGKDEIPVGVPIRWDPFPRVDLPNSGERASNPSGRG